MSSALLDYLVATDPSVPMKPKDGPMDVKWTWRAEVAPWSIFRHATSGKKCATCRDFTNGEGRNRTGDTTIFRDASLAAAVPRNACKRRPITAGR
jgi:hypothetical protein